MWFMGIRGCERGAIAPKSRQLTQHTAKRMRRKLPSGNLPSIRQPIITRYEPSLARTGHYTQNPCSGHFECNGDISPTIPRVNIGNTTTYGYQNTNGVADPYWRLKTVSDPYGSASQNLYSSNSREFAFIFNGASSAEENYENWDGYGRVISTERAQSPAGSNFDTANYAYSWFGNYSQVQSSQPCSSPMGSGCAPLVHTSQYDPLGRLHTAATTSNETLTHTYIQNDDLVALTPIPTGEGAKQTQTEYDGLGRIKSICYIWHAGGGTPCGQ
jgi:hypothetical protein